MIKKVLLVLGSLFLISQSFKITQLIIELSITSIGLSIFLAWLLTLFITGIFALSGFALPTQVLLPENYYFISAPKNLSLIYKLLKVEIFRKLLLATLWKSQKMRKGHFSGGKLGLKQLILQSRKSEFGHILPFIVISFTCIYLIIEGEILISIIALIINVVGNLYPVILQRYHRMRVQRLV